MKAQPVDSGDALAGFTRIRQSAEAFMDKRDSADDGWDEESVTQVAVIEGRPQVQVAEFNHQQEGRGLGADYIWWWIDGSGECFGMLVQAKRLKLAAGQWIVDVTHRDGKQLYDLLDSAQRLEVPAIYSIYTGGMVFRAELPCLHKDADPLEFVAAPAPLASTPLARLPDGAECQRCRRMAISMVTAYQLEACWMSKNMTGNLACTESIPLEDLVDPDVPTGDVWDVNRSSVEDPDLLSFLKEPQVGARKIAQQIFRLVAFRRNQSFTAAEPELLAVSGAPIFTQVPEDRGHFPGPYYRHVLQGLRSRPPEYVEDLLAELDGRGSSAALALPRELEETGVVGAVIVLL